MKLIVDQNDKGHWTITGQGNSRWHVNAVMEMLVNETKVTTLRKFNKIIRNNGGKPKRDTIGPPNRPNPLVFWEYTFDTEAQALAAAKTLEPLMTAALLTGYVEPE